MAPVPRIRHPVAVGRVRRALVALEPAAVAADDKRNRIAGGRLMDTPEKE